MHVRGLLERGHTVEVWTPSMGDRSYLPLSELAPEHVIPFAQLPDRANNPVFDALLSYRRVREEVTRMDACCAQAAQEIEQGGFDVLFANTCHLYYSPAVGRFTKIPRVLYLQEPNRKIFEGRPRLQWIGPSRSQGGKWTPRRVPQRLVEAARMRKSRIHAQYELDNANAYDTILVNSFFSRESLLRCYGLDAKVCYLGIDTARFVNHDRERENFVIGVGALLGHKNIEFVIQAIGAMKESKKENKQENKGRPRLVWVGNMVAEDYRDYLEGLARSLGVCLEIKVMATDAEMVDLLNRAAMMVYAPRLEPFGYAPLEANACGLPVVTVAEGGVRETVIDGVNGLLVEGEPHKMAAAIERLLQNPALARQMGENACRLVRERWSLDAATDRLEHYLQQTINAAASPTQQ